MTRSSPSLEALNRADLIIRPARAADRPAVEAIAAQIWDGHDYLPDVFDDWLADESGRFFVAAYHGRVVGLGKLTCLAPGHWWLEGLRVDPAYQGRGVGRVLHHFLVNKARQFAPGTVRFSTADENAAVRKLAAETGFQAAAVFAPYGAGAGQGGGSGLVALAPPDLERGWIFLERDAPHFEATQRTLEDRWTFLPLTPDLLRERLAAGQVYGWSGGQGGSPPLAGLAILNAPRERDEGDSRLYVGYLDAVPGQLEALALALRGLAAEQGREGVSLKAVNTMTLLDALEAAGYERRWDHDVLLFARALSLTAQSDAQGGAPQRRRGG